jgi:anti-sigma regulatory factor (Ser/Thr protein kinase)
MTADHGEFHGDHVDPDGDHMDPDGYCTDPDGYCTDPDGYCTDPDGYYMDPDGYHVDSEGDDAGPDGQETRRRLRLALPPDVPTVRLARQATRDTLAAWQLSHLEEVAVLVVSELVTNAVLHARDTGAIGLELASAGTRLRVEVQDGDPHWRLQYSPAECDESGFGFVLVDSLAGRWGIRRVSAGKAVWAELEA